MTDHALVKLYEHNHWANMQIIDACAALSDDQLDAAPQAALYGSIRETLVHLVRAQNGYLRMLTLPREERMERVEIPYDEVRQSATATGEGFIALAGKVSQQPQTEIVVARDGYRVEPWVIMTQAINHATEHREQIKSMLSTLGVTPPEIDGWTYGEAVDALNPPAD